MSHEHKKRQFSSQWGFVLSAVGSAVGMANVWGFPAKMGSNGGGAFLIAYLIFIALFGTVGLAAEYAVGRRARTGTLGAYEMAWGTRKKELGRWPFGLAAPGGVHVHRHRLRGYHLLRAEGFRRLPHRGADDGGHRRLV